MNGSVGDAEDGRHAVDGEHDVGAFDHQQHQEQRRDAEPAVLADEEGVAVLAVVAAADAAATAGRNASTTFFSGCTSLLGVHGQLQRRVDQQQPEQRQHPIEMADQLHAGQHERQPQHDRAQNAPEQHAVLVLQRDAEEAEDHREHEDVVHRQRPFDDVAGQEGQAPRLGGRRLATTRPGR